MTQDAHLGRREFILGTAALLTASGLASNSLGANQDAPIIDTHIHLFDPTRPQGAPYRGPARSIYSIEGAFPQNYEPIARQHNVVGAVKVEASPWFEDNLWAIELCANSDVMVGYIGNFKIDDPDFPSYIDRFSRYEVFRGVRYGNLWGYNIGAQSTNPLAIQNLKILSAGGFVLDTANPSLDLLQAVVRISDQVPELTIVLDHLPKFNPEPSELSTYFRVLEEIAHRSNIVCKVSAIIHRNNGVVSDRLVDHRERLDLIMETFGPDRVVFGTDWPNNEADTVVDNVFSIAHAYFSERSAAESRKYFWENSVKIYRWIAKTDVQKALKDSVS